MFAGCKSGVELRRGGEESHERLGDAAVFLPGFLDDAGLHEVLELFVGAEPQHLFASAGQIASGGSHGRCRKAI